MRKAIFLDRDGVINQAEVRDGRPYPPSTLSEMKLLPGAKEALLSLHNAGYFLVVVTNQPDVARGTTPMYVVEEINDFLMEHLPIDEFRTCFHDNDDDCDCRKPKPGALIAAAEKHGLDLANSYMVGDRWRDMDAGSQAGCKTIFIDYGYNEKQPETFDHRAKALSDAASIILGSCNETG